MFRRTKKKHLENSNDFHDSASMTHLYGIVVLCLCKVSHRVWDTLWYIVYHRLFMQPIYSVVMLSLYEQLLFD